MIFYKTALTGTFIFVQNKNHSPMKKILVVAIMYLAFLSANAQTDNSGTQTKKRVSSMKEFSFVVRVPVSYSKEQVQQANSVWTTLLENWKKEGAYIISFPFPAEGYVVSGKEKSIKKGSVTSDDQRVVSCIFLRAGSIDEATELAKTFPVLEFGGSVEVREILQRPNSSN
jgi:hypothetical protein